MKTNKNPKVTVDGHIVQYGDLSIEIVRAFAGSEKAREAGIYFNFSIKVLAYGTVIGAVNALTIRQNQNGKPYVGSASQKFVDGRGQERNLSLFSFFPMEEGQANEQHDAAVVALLAAIKAFIVMKQTAAVERTTQAKGPCDAIRAVLDGIPTPSKKQAMADDLPFA
jgi:hypothetical protein